MKKPKSADTSISIQQMLDTLPRGCLGEFDFISGVIFIDCGQAEHQALVTKREKLGNRWDEVLSDHEKLLVETTLHEYYHYLQVLSSGYLFETVCALLDGLTTAATRLKQNDKDNERLAAFARLAQRILRPLAEPHETTDLSPRDLIEGAAYYFQCRSLGRARDHASMLKAMEAPDLEPEYTRAYMRAALKLEQHAFHQFLRLVGTALYFADPPAAFEDLIGHAALTGTSRKSHVSEKSAAGIADRHPFIGTATHVRTIRDVRSYPWYETPISRLAKSKAEPPAFFFISNNSLLPKIQPPMAFRDGFKGDLGIPIMMALMAIISGQRTLRFTLPYTGVKRAGVSAVAAGNR